MKITPVIPTRAKVKYVHFHGLSFDDNVVYPPKTIHAEEEKVGTSGKYLVEQKSVEEKRTEEGKKTEEEKSPSCNHDAFFARVVDLVNVQFCALSAKMDEKSAEMEKRIKANEDSIVAFKKQMYKILGAQNKSTSAKDAQPMHLVDDSSDGDGDDYKISYRPTPSTLVREPSPSTPVRDHSPQRLDRNDSNVNELLDTVIEDTNEKETRAEKKNKEEEEVKQDANAWLHGI